MTGRDKFGLRDAYGVRTPEDNLRLYAKWAPTYENDFVAANGYVLHRRVAEALARRLTDHDAAILDVGCGTGIGGQVLRHLGFSTIDGVDLSPAMLDIAGRKRLADGSPIYRALFEADLTRGSNLPHGGYGGIVSAGTFTHGHLGPDSLGSLWEGLAAGAIGAIGINAMHYGAEAFADVLAADVTAGIIEVVDVLEVDIYRKPPADLEPGNDKANVAVVRVAR